MEFRTRNVFVKKKKKYDFIKVVFRIRLQNLSRIELMFFFLEISATGFKNAVFRKNAFKVLIENIYAWSLYFGDQ